MKFSFIDRIAMVRLAVRMLMVLLAILALPSRATIEIQFWHAMGGPATAHIDAVVRDFNLAPVISGFWPGSPRERRGPR